MVQGKRFVELPILDMYSSHHTEYKGNNYSITLQVQFHISYGISS